MSCSKKCDMCGKDKRNVEQVPSRSQLLFGGFRVRLENRCPACERKVAKWVESSLKSIGEEGNLVGSN